MTTKKVDPNEGLAADATLATDLGDEKQRFLDQIAEMGGEHDDDDDFDATGLDDGSDLNYKAPEDDKKDDDDASKNSDDDKSADDSDDDESSDEGDGDEADEADEDEDADADATEDGTDADEADADEDGDQKKPAAKTAPKGIPKHRFDQVNERAKAAEKELAELKAEKAAGEKTKEDPFDFDAAEKQYLELSLDGDIDAALAKRKEIRAAEHADWSASTKAATKSDIATEAEDAELVSLSQEAEAMFSVFDPESDDFDQGKLDQVLVYYRGYAASGKASNKGDAFVMALADVVEMHGLDATDEADADPGPKPTGKKKTGGKKKADAKKNAHQPVAGEGTGSADTGAVVPNINDMTDEEMDALPEKTLARLRGDFI